MAPNVVSPLAGLLLLLLVQQIRDASASSSSSNPSHHQPDITAFTFQSDNEEDLYDASLYPSNSFGHGVDSNDDDDDDDDCDQEDASAFASSLLYDAGCVVSASAVMCDDDSSSSKTRSFIDNNLHTSSSLLFDYDCDDQESEDDDDDDDNDGHSSMLSNASLRRRTKVGASGSSTSSSYNNNNNNNGNWQEQGGSNGVGKKEAASTAAFLQKYQNRASVLKQAHRKPFLSKAFLVKSNKNTKALLSMRGGAAGGVSDLGTEFAKKLVVTALVTLLYEGMIGHMLEFIKVCMQTSEDGTTYGTVIRSITTKKGILGLWDGFVPWGVIQSLCKGSIFGLAHAVASSLLVPLAEKGTMPMPLALTLAGGIGGGFQGFVLSPTLLLKTRVMTSAVFREKMSLAKTTYLSAKIGLDVVATEGVGALMKGADVFATKRVFDWASRYYFSDLFETLAINHKGGLALTVAEKILCSLLGGTVSTYVTLPLDALVAKIQDAKKAGEKVSAWKLFQDELREKGWIELKNSYMKGFEVRLLHVALTTVAVKTGSPIAYDLLFPSPVAAAP